MKYARLLGTAMLFLATAATEAQPMGRGMMGGGPMMGGGSARHVYVMRNGLPEAYRWLSNPLQATDANVAAGKKLYQAQCSACHGTSGNGDGPAATALNPPPADLRTALRMRIADDAYLFWTISEGGSVVHSAMPPFKAGLSKDAIWQIILYLRTL